MKARISQIDITNYALNEMSASERLYVESMMLVSEEVRKDVVSMLELSSLLEDAMASETEAEGFKLDGARRSLVLEQEAGSVFWLNVRRVGTALGALAACIAFSLSAPLVWNQALRGEASKMEAARGGSPMAGATASSKVSESLLQSRGVLGGEGVGMPEELPARVLLPTSTVEFLDMNMPGFGTEEN